MTDEESGSVIFVLGPGALPHIQSRKPRGIDMNTHDKSYDATMGLIDVLGDACQGHDYFDAIYALASVLSEVLLDAETVMDESPMPLFAKLFNDLMKEARDFRELEDMDESTSTQH